jgi:penicillin amidase
MRSSLIVALALFLEGSVGGCSGSAAKDPSLTIASSADTTKPLTAPTVFNAVLVNSNDPVTWTLTGDGALSDTAGLHVTYVPKLGDGTATLTAATKALTASVQVTSTPPTVKIPGLTAPVTVKYDAQDVPHIQCAQAVDCVSAQGYLQARDRLFPMDFLRHVARGRVSELVGPDGLSQDIQFRTFFTTRDGKRIEDELIKAIDPATKKLLDGFVVGVNAYLAELRASHGALPGEYAQLPFPLTAADIADWTEQDTLAMARLQQFQLSESLTTETANGKFALTYGPGAPHADAGRMEAWIRAAAPATEQAHTLAAAGTHAPVTASASPAAILPGKRVRLADLSKWGGALTAAAAKVATLRERLRPADAAVGSNNWVIAGAKSATHVAMVANDPHLSLQYPPLFHLAVMTSSNPADHLNLTGGSFPGIPGALVGRGEHVGWGVTVVGYDVTDVYMEQFLSQSSCPGGASGPPCVLFKGAPVSTIVVPQTYLVRVGSGAAGLQDAKTIGGLLGTNQDKVIIVPHHGPVIQPPDGANKGLSFRWTGHEPNTQDLKAFYGLNTAVDVNAAIEALKNYATGAQNFVLADDQGHIAYDPHALVPLRAFADARQAAAFDPAHPPWFPVPGDDGKHEWGDGTSNCANPAGAPAVCWTADADLPQGKDPAKGYFFTANADPTSLPGSPNQGVSDDNSPLAHPPYLSFDWDDSSGFRATRIEQRIEQALRDHNNVSLADMESIQADHVSRLGMAFETAILGLPTAGAPPELAAAQGVIAQWKAAGWDCPSGVVGTDPKGPADPTAKVVQNSAGCFLFHEFLRALVTNVFTDDLKVAGQGINALAAAKALLFMLSLDPADTRTDFCDDVDAAGKIVAPKTCSAQVAAALVQAFDTLAASVGANPTSWVWGRVHTIRPVSLLQLVTTNYQPGPFARPGGAFTVDVGNPSLSGSGLDFQYFSGGNVRHISLMDPANPKVRMQLPGPERDGPAVGPGPDLLGQWVKNTYFDYAHGDQINGAAVAIQSFKAP